jgi:hypothetical protein
MTPMMKKHTSLQGVSALLMVAATSLAIAGCSGDDEGSQQDAATHDAATHDAATHDAATHDAATHDAATHDAATHDAATHDAAPDAGPYAWRNPEELAEFTQDVNFHVHHVDADGDLIVLMKVGSNIVASSLYSRRHTDAAGWGPLETVDDTGLVAFIHTLEGDPAGNLLLIWQANNTFNYLARTYTKQTGQWSAPLSLAVTANSQGVQVFRPILLGDTFHVVTYERQAGVANYYLRRHSAALGWSEAEQIHQGGEETSMDGVFHVDGQDNLHLLWRTLSGNQLRILYSKRNNGEQGWSEPEIVFEAPSSHVVSSMQLIEDSQGFMALFNYFDRAVVSSHVAVRDLDGSWQATNFTRYGVFTQIGDILYFVSGRNDSGTQTYSSQSFTRAGGLGEPEQISAGHACGAVDLQEVKVAADSAGRMVAAWMSCVGTVRQLWLDMYQPGKGWEGARQINVQPVESLSFRNTRIFFNQRDDVFIFWPTFAHSNSGFLASAMRSAGGTWTAETLLEANGAGLSISYDVAVHPDGIHALWEKKPHSTAGTFFTKRYDLQTGWHAEEALTAAAQYPGTFNSPKLVVLPSQRILAFMYWYDGSVASLYAAEYRN